MAEKGMVDFLIKELGNFNEQQLREHLIKEGHSPEVVDASMKEALSARSNASPHPVPLRISRATYIALELICAGAALLSMAFLSEQALAAVEWLIAGVTLAFTAARIHDLDRSGWWALMWFVPILKLALIIGLVFRRGTDGPNRFGPDPLKA